MGRSNCNSLGEPTIFYRYKRGSYTIICYLHACHKMRFFLCTEIKTMAPQLPYYFTGTAVPAFKAGEGRGGGGQEGREQKSPSAIGAWKSTVHEFFPGLVIGSCRNCLPLACALASCTTVQSRCVYAIEYICTFNIVFLF